MLHPQLAWYIAGPLLGICVVACRALFNARLGVTGGFSELVGRPSQGSLGFGCGGPVGRLSQGSLRFDWRCWFAIGIFVGGGLFALIAGGPDFHGYGWLTDAFSSHTWIAAILLVAGVLIGFGAKLAGGCTSGNGLSGTSMLSPAALAATATFFGTAIVVSFAIEAVIS